MYMGNIDLYTHHGLTFHEGYRPGVIRVSDGKTNASIHFPTRKAAYDFVSLLKERGAVNDPTQGITGGVVFLHATRAERHDDHIVRLSRKLDQESATFDLTIF